MFIKTVQLSPEQIGLAHCQIERIQQLSHFMISKLVQNLKLQRILKVCCAFMSLTGGLKQFLTLRLCPLGISNMWQPPHDN